MLDPSLDHKDSGDSERGACPSWHKRFLHGEYDSIAVGFDFDFGFLIATK
jgi:hypothetical protein